MIGGGWLRKRVRAFYGTDYGRTRIEGTVVAYSATPQVLIEAEDGSRDWWGVDLVEVLDGEMVTHFVENQRIDVFRPGSAAFIASRKPETLHPDVTVMDPPYGRGGEGSKF